jgi:hypothetical protein
MIQCIPPTLKEWAIWYGPNLHRPYGLYTYTLTCSPVDNCHAYQIVMYIKWLFFCPHEKKNEKARSSGID